MKSLKPQEVFEYLNIKYKYIAMNKSGSWYCFDKIPKYDQDDDFDNTWDLDCFGDEYHIPLNISYTGDWKDSLHCREEQIMWIAYEPLDNGKVSISMDDLHKLMTGCK